MEKIVEYKNVMKAYDGVVVLRPFSLAIYEGDFLCVVGGSGSGKTTLMKMINGLTMPTEGKVLIRGEEIFKKDIIRLRRKIGYSIQGSGLFPHMTVAENIGYVPRLDGKSKEEVEELINHRMDLVGLDHQLKGRYPEELSGGQQQRVGIARAYANSPDILLMDEPFGAVDSITRSHLQKDLKLIHKKTNCTVVFITHDIYEAFRLGTHILVLNEGNIEQFGSVDEVRKHPAEGFVEQLVEMSRWGME